MCLEGAEAARKLNIRSPKKRFNATTISHTGAHEADEAQDSLETTTA